ncbi:DNA topoisomerase IV subunit A [Polymorphobacter sp. PAMC 29334]|uniref:DNA topoisomerase IV subunit A n=1 Tax=Polymorphobacter sp. PAMC 29334 TaxID=2862331 RepID=UPI001C7769ED|nr:DNA topoisomerase IV subunit A [Polymorphobacter sp. PAMC 29334]QYE34124.1 DNA topoisomerase IV subunit A [Polymorphobacter sp. PAMC 29334]
MLEDPRILDTPFADALSERYLVYALSTITARSLPDVRDGLKPVHRRILWGMRLLKLDPATGYKKCARIVGDVMGKYHPHGDASIYDALVRLSQSFALRYPLIDGQGNFGNIDGDNAAAMRYTEARLTIAAADLMDGLDENSVAFRETYNGEEEEPEVFPAAFPNLLANGASGIAVGMATSIPPHNVAEIADAATVLLDNPEASIDELMQHLKGPDFPTGGVVVEPASAITQAYATGRGSFRLRARWSVEPAGNGTWVIAVTEIPYQVQKGKLIEDIATLINDKKLPILTDVRDESDTAIRLILEPRSRNVDPGVLMESLFKLTDLETRFPLNLNVLDRDHVPRVMPLKAVLQAYLDHQIEVTANRTTFRLTKIDDRLELLDGYLKAYLSIDEVIRIIREEDEPKAELIRRFDLNERQAEAILNLRLRALRRLEEIEITKEHKALSAEASKLRALLDSPKAQAKRLRDDLAKLRKRYGPETELGRRLTEIGTAPVVSMIPLEAMIDREPLTVIVSAKGWIRAMKGHVDLTAPDLLKFKEGDGPAFAFHAHTTDRIVIAAATGRFYTLGADRLPGGRGFGEPVRLMIDLDGAAAIVALFVHRPGERLLLAASDGRGFIVTGDDLLAETRKGRQVMTPRAGANLKIVRPIPADDDHLGVVGDNRKLLIIKLDDVPVMARGQGVALQKYRDGGVADITSFKRADGLSWAMGGSGTRTRTEADVGPWVGPRGGIGRMPPQGFPRDNKFA